jgi:replicative DNA helicase
VTNLASPENELALLCCLLSPEYGAKVYGLCLAQRITEAHFDTPAHRLMYRAIVTLHTDAEPVDIITVTNHLRDAGWLDDCGGPAYITDVFTRGNGLCANAAAYCARLDDKRRVRAANALSDRIRAELSDPVTNLNDWLAGIADEAAGIGMHVGALKSPAQSARNFLNFYERIESGAPMVSCGIDAVDLQAGPFMRSDLVVVSGVTGGGKSALVNSFIDRSIDTGQCCAVFTLEMSEIQYMERIAAARAGVNMHGVRQLIFKKQRIAQEIFTKIGDAMNKYANSNVYLVDDVEHLSEMEGKCLQIHARKPLDIIVLDYAQLLSAPGDSREREVANVSKGMKHLAKKLNCVVFLLSQLNDDGRLRESRAIGHDANVVLNIERDDRSTWVRVSKGRSCPAGTQIPLKWIPEFTKFENIGSMI